MITKFKIFEAITPDDFKKDTELNIEIDDNRNNAADKDLKNQSNLKITDIQNKIQFLNKQKIEINKEIIKLQDAQRDLVPNNTNDPKNAEKIKTFIDDQKQKMLIQQNKLDLFNKEIDNLSKEIERNKKKYGI